MGGSNYRQGQECCIPTHWSGYMGWETSQPCHYPLTIQEGRWVIAQAVMDCQEKARGLGLPHVNPSTQQPFRFNCTRCSPQRTCLRRLVLTIDHCHIGPPEAKIAIDIGGTKGHHCPSCCCLPLTVGLKVTGVHYQLPHQCHLGQIDQRDLSIPDVGDGIEKMEPI